MKFVSDIWALFIRWIKIKLKSPFSNIVTKTILVVGAAVVASPMIEHLVFSAILNHVIGIDLGIKVPDTNAYIFGTCLILIAAIHNLIYLHLNKEYEIQIKTAKTSIYKELWGHCDTMIDDVVRLSNLYLPDYSKRDDELYLKAEYSVAAFMDFMRVNRPFWFSEEFYEKCMELKSLCLKETSSFAHCITQKKQYELHGESEDYRFHEIQKVVSREMDKIESEYESICSDIREYIDSV